MSTLEESVLCRAPAMRVWKLLYDPVRFSEWWSGLQRSEPSRDGVDFYLADGAGPFPMRIATTPHDPRHDTRVMIRCTATDDLYTWTLEPHPDGCRVRVRVDVAGDDTERLATRRDGLVASLPRLAELAEADGDAGEVARQLPD